MKIKNKKNGTNVLAYKVSGVTEKIIIPSGAIVDLVNLIDLNQIVNKKDFNIGWFEVVKESQLQEVKNNNILDKAKKDAEDYSKEKVNNK